MKLYNQKFTIPVFALLFLFSSCTKEFDKNPGQSISTSSADLAGARSKPNIILVIGDDVGREIPTYNGGESYTTTNMDFMAANGMQFSYFFSHPDGPPSRLALVTGQYNYRNWEDFGYLPPTSKTFANMLHDQAGYSTCFTGKWQFDGGDTSIHNHGFDKYLVFMPFNPDANNGHDQFYHRYKNPYLYQDAQYLTSAQVEGKYSEDMFYDYASNFIDSNKTKPFLLVYSNSLVQKPWVPTPDDPDYASWNPDVDDVNRVDRKYFPGMVAYLDKTLGKLITKVQTAGIANNTIIMFVSDNATNKSIVSQYKGQMISGSKDSTTFNGINVPFLIYAPGRIAAGVKDTSLVDMTDFFPTFANIAKVTSTTSYLPLDGTTFYDNMTGTVTANKQRSSVYCYWPRSYQGKADISYVCNYTYKLYNAANNGNFYNIVNDVYEQHPIPNSQLTPTEKKTKNQFSKILQQSN